MALRAPRVLPHSPTLNKKVSIKGLNHKKIMARRSSSIVTVKKQQS
jgi:hypothetical protein